MKQCNFLANLNIHHSWESFLTDQIRTLLIDIEKEIKQDGQSITPPQQLVLRFLEMDISRIKVIILGQDPYPQQGVATGRAFEVNGLNSWKIPFRNVSLKNMLRAIYKAYHNKTHKYNEIVAHINEGDQLSISGDFMILPPNRLFEYWWKDQNVLLLNTSFTCSVGNPNSHTRIWAPFTRSVLEYICQTNQGITWFLWGNNAQKVVEGISINHKIETSHPMICYQREKDILFGNTNPFEATKEMIDWTGFSKPQNP